MPRKAFQEHPILGRRLVPAPSQGLVAVMPGPMPSSATDASAEGSVAATPSSWVPWWARWLL